MKKIILSIFTMAALSVSAQLPGGSQFEFEFTNGSLANTSASGANALSGTFGSIIDRYNIMNNAVDATGTLNGTSTGAPNTVESTLSFWMRPTPQSGNQRVLQMYGAGGNGYRVEYDGANDKMFINLEMNGSIASSSQIDNVVIDDNQWHNIIVRTSYFSGSGVEIEVFVDKVLQTITNPTFTTTITDFINNANFSISPLNNYTGDIDDIVFYKSALTDAEITQVYQYPYINIPDGHFKNWLVNQTAIDANNDNQIQYSEALAQTGTLSCYSQHITDFTGVEAFLNITGIICSNNQFTNFDISKNVNITELNINGCGMPSVDISNNTSLTILKCRQNTFTTLDITQCTALTLLECGENQLQSLDVSQCLNLITLSPFDNNLTNIDVSQLSSLETLLIGGNVLTSLDLSQNLSLKSLNCLQNSITMLDLSQNTALEFLYCGDNALTDLHLANGNNANMLNGYFNSINNPNLTCIQVDNVAYSNTNWGSDKDAVASFSTGNCPHLVTSIALQGQSGATIIAINGGTLQINATVLPANVTDGTYTWSVANGTGSATINSSGLLAAQTNGTVTVVATANDGSGITGSIAITIGGQYIGLTSVTVQGQGGVSTIAPGATLYMEVTMLPANATAPNYTLSVANGTGTATISVGGLLTAVSVGTVTVTATGNAGGSTMTGSTVITIANQNVTVSSITVQGNQGLSDITVAGGTLEMSASVLPTNATDASVIWSVVNGTGSATISLSNNVAILEAQSDGTVTVVATATDGSGVTGSKVITLSNQSVGLKEINKNLDISVFPNPTTGKVTFSTTEQITRVEVYNLAGRKVDEFNNRNTINISKLPKGVYAAKITSKSGNRVMTKLVKE